MPDADRKPTRPGRLGASGRAASLALDRLLLVSVAKAG